MCLKSIQDTFLISLVVYDIAAHITFSLLFGGGAKYSNGEDSLFLKDCLKYGLVVYAVPVCVYCL